MALVFLKTHLKDREHRLELDRRKGQALIADVYDWKLLYHVHCVARTFYSGRDLDPQVAGSLFTFPVKNQVAKDTFDFVDLYQAQTMLVRIGDTALIAVFNDGGATCSIMAEKLGGITAPLNELQIREILVDVAYLNLRLDHRPEFATNIDLEKETASIAFSSRECQVGGSDLELRGKLLRHALRDVLPSIQPLNQSNDEMQKAIDAGTHSFLWNEKGEFLGEDWVALEAIESHASDPSTSVAIPVPKADGTPM